MDNAQLSSNSEADRANEAAALDDALRLGLTGIPGTPEAPSQFSQSPAEKAGDLGELRGISDCLRLLHRAWPRPARVPLVPRSVERIGRFEIVRLLGHGGFGIVYLARDPRLDRLVALKIPRPHVLAHAELHERFQREARAAAALDHPNIVPILETGESGPVSYIASAYCSGPSLAQWLKEQSQPVPPRTAAQIAAALTQGVDYSHRHGILHRDLKPANVLLFPSQSGTDDVDLPFVPRLADFGLAKLRDPENSGDASSLLLGTPVYMAPEQMRRGEQADGALSDVYSLGVMLYELLIGRPPFQGTSFVDVFDQARSAEPVALRRLRRDIPVDLETICLKCLEKEPERRYSSAALLLTDLRNCLEGRPISARPVGTVGTAFRWIRRNPDRAALSAVAVGSILAAAGLWLWSTAQLASQQAVVVAVQETERLRESAVLSARIQGRRQARSTGWQTDNLVDLASAGSLTENRDLRRQLRNEAVAALCAVELRRVEVLRTDFDGFGLVYSPDGKQIAVGRNSDRDGFGQVLLFDAESRKEVRRIAFERSPSLEERPTGRQQIEGVRSLLFSDDGSRLTIGTRGGMIHCWNVENGEQQSPSWQAHSQPVVSLVRLAEQDILASLAADNDARVRYWRESTGELLLDVPLAANHCERLTALGNDLFVMNDLKLQCWRFDLRERNSKVVWNREYGAAISAAHPDHRSIVCDAQNDLLGVDVASGVPTRRWTDPHRKKAHPGNRHEIQISNDARWLISSATEGLKLWDLTAGTVLATIPSSSNSRVSAAFHPSRPEFTITREGRIEVWEIDRRDFSNSALNRSFPVCAVDLSGDGGTLAGMIREHPETLRFVGQTIDDERKLPDLLIERIIEPATALSTDGGMAAVSAAGSQTGLTLARSDTPEPPQIISRAETAFAFSPDDKRLWYRGTVDVDQAEAPLPPVSDVGFVACVSLPDLAEEFRSLNSRSQRESHRSAFLSLAAGSRYAVASSIDVRVRLFDADNRSLVWESSASQQIVDAVAIDSPESAVVCGTRAGEVLGLALDDGRPLFRVAAHDDGVTTVAFAKGLVVSGGNDGRVIVWRRGIDSLEPLFQIGPLGGAVVRCVLNRDAARLAVLVENEFGVRLFELAKLEAELRRLELGW